MEEMFWRSLNNNYYFIKKGVVFVIWYIPTLLRVFTLRMCISYVVCIESFMCISVYCESPSDVINFDLRIGLCSGESELCYIFLKELGVV